LVKLNADDATKAKIDEDGIRFLIESFKNHKQRMDNLKMTPSYLG
jgi:hypothetical protein